MPSDAHAAINPDDLLPADLKLDEQGRLVDEIPCRVCGYNLRAADPHGVCPECGTAVGWSVVGDLLHYSPPQWVRRVARGGNAIVGAVALVLTLFSLGIFYGVATDGHGGLDAPRWIEVVSGLAVPTAAILVIVGVWLLTTPEPGRSEQECGLHARILARYSMFVSFLALVVGGFANAYAARYAPSGSVIAVIGFLTVLASLFIAIVGYFAFFTWLRRLARRMPDYSLARQTLIVMWGLVISYGLMIVAAAVTFVAIMATIGTATPPRGAAAGGSFLCVAVPLLLIFAVWAVLLIDRYRRQLNHAAAQAEATWAAHSR